MLQLPPIFSSSMPSSFGMSLVVIIMISGLLVGLVMGITAMFFAHQRRRLWHDTARLALEKGQPLPAFEPDEARRAPRPGTDLNQHDLRGGLVLVAVGAGVFLFLRAVADARVAWLGAVPGFIGLALILHWGVTRLTSPKKNSLPPPNA